MASEVGVAYVSIAPSAKGFASKLQREIGSDLARAGREGGDDFGKEFSKAAAKEAGSSQTSGKIGDGLKAGLATAGVAAGVALVAGVGTALDRGKLDAKLSAQLGGGPQTKRATKAAASLFAGAWGDSVEDVNTAVASVVTNIGGMRKASEKHLKGITRSVLDISSAFDQDASSITRAADQLVRTDLAKGPRQALDIITKGFQSGANEADDLLDTYTEYGTQFRKLGFDGKEATGLLTQGLKAGARDADVVADSFKEFSIRAVDGSKLTKQGFDELGLSAQDMQEKIGKGGKSAADATALVLDKLRAIKDPAERSQAAVKLFGTQAEDMGDALYALDPTHAVDTLGKVRGAANKMGDELNDNASTRITEFKRTLQSDFVNFLGDEVIPKADAMYQAWKDMPGPLKTASKWLGVIGGVGAGGAFLGAKFLGAIGTAKDVLGGLGSKSKTVAGDLEGIGSAATSSKGKLGKFGSFLGSGGAWGLAIAGGILAIGAFAKEQHDAKVRVDKLTDSFDDQTGAITKNTAKLIINRAQQEGAYDRAGKAGVSADLLTKALLGNHDAIVAVNRQLDKTIENDQSVADSGRGLVKVYGDNALAAQSLKGQLGNANSELGKARNQFDQQRQATRLVNDALKDSKGIWKDATGATKDNAKAADGNRRELLDLADQMGLNKKQTRDLIKTYGDVPKKIETDAVLHTGDASRDRDNFLQSTKDKFRDLGNDTYAIVVNGQSGHGRIFADGGFTGPGAKYEPAGTVHKGEWVTKQESTSKMERRFPGYLDYINRHGTLPGFAGGGMVGGKVNTKVNLNLAQLREVVSQTIKSLSFAGGVGPTLAWARQQVGDSYLMGGTGPDAWDCSGFMSGITNKLMGRSPYHRLFATSSFPTSMFARGLGVFSIGSTRDAGGGIGHMAGTLGGVNVESRGGEGVVVGPNARGATDPLFGGNIWHLKPGLIRTVAGGGRGDPATAGGRLSAAERWIIAHEAGPAGVHANNPNSSAFGLGQLLSSNRMKYAGQLGYNVGREAGDTGTTAYGKQLAMMRAYIGDRYGTAANAKQFWVNHGYYDTSTDAHPGVLKPGWTAAYNGTGRDEYITNRKPQPQRRGPTRIVLDAGSIGKLSGYIDDRIDGALDFEASTGRM